MDNKLVNIGDKIFFRFRYVRFINNVILLMEIDKRKICNTNVFN